MLNNIEFIEYNEHLEEDILDNKIKKTSIILINCIANTEIYDKNYIIKLNKYNYIGTNIYYYFGYSNMIIKNITKKNVQNLLCNILIKQDDKIIWSDIIIKYYNIYFNNYTNKQISILNKLLEEIKVLYFKIFEDIKLLDNKKYDLDIVNKSIYEYVNDNLDVILNKLFTKINVFYILSICFNSNNNYLLIYEKYLLDIIKTYLF
tara:strand:- start:3154 stop:3768 length:615 start_codon:yes stop_codon:yes gene_type:complete